MTTDADYADRSYDRERRQEADAAAKRSAEQRASLPLAERCRPVQMVPRRERSIARRFREESLAAARAAGNQDDIAYHLGCLDNLRRYNPSEYYPVIRWTADGRHISATGGLDTTDTRDGQP